MMGTLVLYADPETMIECSEVENFTDRNSPFHMNNMQAE